MFKPIEKLVDFSTMDIPNALKHVKFRDGSDRIIQGCHDAVEFRKIRQVDAIGNPDYKVAIGKTLDEVEEIVIVGIKKSTTPGVEIIEYKIPARDAKTKTTGGLKGLRGNEPYIKLIYDPSIWTDTKLEKDLKEALQDVLNKEKGVVIPEKFIGKTSEGYTIEGYFKNGKIETFYFLE